MYAAAATVIPTIAPSTGPFLSASAGDISAPISITNANVQSPKKVPNIIPAEAGSPTATALRTSVATICIQYDMPARTVTTALQRNHHKARDISLGTTIPRDFASSSCTKGTFTRVKKYNSPTQAMPATKWIQRSTIRAVAAPPGNWISGERSSATSEIIILVIYVRAGYPAHASGSGAVREFYITQACARCS